MNPLQPVSDIMSTQLITVMPSTPLVEVVPLFEKHGIHHVPVVGPDRELAGIVAESDLLKLIGKSEREVYAMHADGIMTTSLAKLEPTDNVATAASLFMLNRFHALPVVEGSRIVGLVTTLDLIKLIDEHEVELEDYSGA